MEFIIKQNILFKALQQINQLGGHQILPILNNFLIRVTEDCLLIVSSSLETEIRAKVFPDTIHKVGSITIPARKLINICRGFSKDEKILFSLKESQILIQSKKSYYWISTLPSSDFPNIYISERYKKIEISHLLIKNSIESVQFSIANQDVRYYLNGMLLKIENRNLTTVSTDGHRLSICSTFIDTDITQEPIIIPKRGVISLLRILSNSEDLIQLKISKNNICVVSDSFTFISKLIDGNFPNYCSVLTKSPKKIIELERDILKEACKRIKSISSEKFCGIKIQFHKKTLKIISTNREHEKAEEIVDYIYQGDNIEICINVNYLIDILNILKKDKFKLLINDKYSPLQIEENNNIQKSIYVVMPMRL